MPLSKTLLTRIENNDPSLTVLDLRAESIGHIVDVDLTLLAIALKKNFTVRSIYSNQLIVDDEYDFSTYLHIISLVDRNQHIFWERDPIKKANLLGNKIGSYFVPTLLDLCFFSIKRHLSHQQIKQVKPFLPEELYKTLNKL